MAYWLVTDIMARSKYNKDFIVVVASNKRKTDNLVSNIETQLGVEISKDCVSKLDTYETDGTMTYLHGERIEVEVESSRVLFMG